MELSLLQMYSALSFASLSFAKYWYKLKCRWYVITFERSEENIGGKMASTAANKNWKDKTSVLSYKHVVVRHLQVPIKEEPAMCH